MPMEQSPAILNFAEYVAERTSDFSGRYWVFEDLDRWLNGKPESRYFLLTGDPGSGKTAIACRLAEFSWGKAFPPGTSKNLCPDFLSAIHFCSSQDASWTDPREFSRSISVQLAHRYPEFSAALIEHAGHKVADIRGNAHVDMAHSGSMIAGVWIENLSLRDLDPQEAFNRAVRLPLETMYREGFTQPITILVDALDESLTRKGNVTIVELLSALEQLEGSVRFVLTSRSDERVDTRFPDADGLVLSAAESAEQNLADVNAYISARLADEPTVAHLVVAQRNAAAASISTAADGNFRYAQFLLDDVKRGRRAVDELDDLPEGLDWLYFQSLDRFIAYEKTDWSQYKPVLGVLSVTQEPLPVAKIRRFTKLGDELESRLGVLQQFVRETTQSANHPRHFRSSVYRYGLFHQSVAEFLGTDVLNSGRKRTRNPYYLAPHTWHRRLANEYLIEHRTNGSAKATGQSLAEWDDYGMRFVATHLAEAAESADPEERHADVKLLVHLVLDEEFQKAHLARFGDLPGLRHDLEQAAYSVTLDGAAESLLLLVQSMLGLVAFRREQLNPEALFELARVGQVDVAERRLNLFAEIGREWHLVALLTIAWLAATTRADETRRLLDQIQRDSEDPLLGGPLRDLAAQVQCALSEQGPPSPRYMLPEPVPQYKHARELVNRLGGAADIELLSYYRDRAAYDDVHVGTRSDYVAQEDAPLLVRFADEHEEEGTQLLEDYLTLHSEFGYVEYRNRSLWYVLEAVLRHPRTSWVRDFIPKVVAVALSGGAAEFQLGLPTTVLGLRDVSIASDKSGRLDSQIAQTLEESRSLSQGRGQGDSWGNYRRRLGNIAEVLASLLDRRTEADRLLDHASNLPRGFAGFQTTASLTLAESYRICQPDNDQAAVREIDAALRAAHNIQEERFCAKATARVNAMQQVWWGPKSPLLSDLAATAWRLGREPGSGEFATLHVVGESYEGRSRWEDRLPLSERLRAANTLSELAWVYQSSVSELMQMNHGIAPDQVLTPGTRIRVPDSVFPALLAARIASEALVSPALSAGDRVDIIRWIVPVAGGNATALDTVLSRLFLAARPENPGLLDEVEAAAVESLLHGHVPGDLRIHLTSFVP